VLPAYLVVMGLAPYFLKQREIAHRIRIVAFALLTPIYFLKAGSLVKFDAKTHQLSEYPPPTQYTTFYEALPDKNGEVWAGELHGGRIVRFNPRADKWIEYVLPEPYSHNRRTWIDNSTDPVAVWYVDHNGYMVRLQPLD